VDDKSPSIILKTVTGPQPSANTSFDLLPAEGQTSFSWEGNPTVENNEDKFFHVAGELMYRPMSSILIELS